MTFISNTPILNNIALPKISFRANPSGIHLDNQLRKDLFSSNPIYDNFVEKARLTQIAKSNPNLMSILKENKIPLKINIEELEKLKNGHLMDTRIVAAKMYSALPNEMKSEVNLPDLQQAAMLHDYGKVLIPEKILNKNGKLTADEKKIMDLHSELGYELLKSQGVKPGVLNMVKYHHQTPSGNGYPSIKNDFTYTIPSQILATADKYSALREARSYKNAMSKEDALNLIRQDVDSGTIAEEIYHALEKAV